MDDGLAMRVREHLLAHLDGGNITLWRVARALGMGERTLQRRLRARGLSFQRLLDQVRRERFAAIAQARCGLAISQETAFALGYSDARSLRRWRNSAGKISDLGQDKELT